MSDYESLVEGYEGLGSPGDDPGPLTPAEEEKLADYLAAGKDWKAPDPEVDEPEPFIEGDGFDTVDVDTSFMASRSEHAGEIRHLRSDQLPVAGKHYVICDGVPRPVVRSGYEVSEDEHVRQNMGEQVDPGRAMRADRTLRMRYRRYLCGESSNL